MHSGPENEINLEFKKFVKLSDNVSVYLPRLIDEAIEEFDVYFELEPKAVPIQPHNKFVNLKNPFL